MEKETGRKTENRRQTGTLYEAKAAEFLKKQGYRVVERNYRCKKGEIDLIARDGEYLVFIEVKYRMDASRGYGMEAVQWKKQKRIAQTAAWYLMEKGISQEQPCRFDVVSFLGEEVTLLRDAFQC